jgi:hypothetical protein
MAFDFIQWMAFIFAAIALIKILVVLIKPKAWMPVVEFFYSKPVVTMIVSLVLAGFTFWYILKELTIVQIFATMVFTALLAMVTVSIYSKEVISVARKMLKDRNFLYRAWVPIVIWVILIVWVLKELFM